MKRNVFENNLIKVQTTGRDYDFIAIVENKSAYGLKIVFDNIFELEAIKIRPYDWIGILADEEGYETLESFKKREFIIQNSIW